MVTIKGKELTLLGEKVHPGQKAPDFKVIDGELKEITLSKFSGKIRVIASVPSLDTPVCDLEIKRFNEEAAGFSNDIAVIFISMDLPFAQKRFCDDYSVDKVETFSDHKEASFGMNYGVLIKEIRLLARAIFIIDRKDVVRYVEYVKEMTEHPDYDRALQAVRDVA